VRVRAAVPGDGAAIARIHRDNAAYYVGLAPDLFRLPDEDGLVEFADPTLEDNSDTRLFIVAEVDHDLVVGHLFAELVSPQDADRFQTVSDLGEVRLFIQALSVLRAYWRQGIATALVEAAEAWGRDHGAAVSLCDTWPDSPVSLPFWQRMAYQTRSVRLRRRLDR
jgi:GNAT superfamily N-acetyltransferase